MRTIDVRINKQQKIIYCALFIGSTGYVPLLVSLFSYFAPGHEITFKLHIDIKSEVWKHKPTMNLVPVMHELLE